MLHRLVIRNFKRFDEVEIDIASPVVFVGPNNSGKTTALQALALWDVGRLAWISKRRDKDSPTVRPGVLINRKDLLAVPVPTASLLWRERHLREGFLGESGKRKTANVRIDVELHGTDRQSQEWSCGIEFDYQNEESFICRPLRLPQFRLSPVSQSEFSQIPSGAIDLKFAYLPPMSGLVASEPKWEPGRINVLIGEGQTAQVLRNLCHLVETEQPEAWDRICELLNKMFGVRLNAPVHQQARGEITMEYVERGVTLDISAAGRGLQQTLLILTHLYRNPGSVLLLDEPDAHLEVLRQKSMFNNICEIAGSTGSQVITATHSEVILDEAANTGSVVAFVGRPHLLNRQTDQVKKALRDYSWMDYSLAEQRRWVVYFEGDTDHLILMEFARLLGHPVKDDLEHAFVHPVGTNLPSKAREHFYALSEASPDLLGVAVFDRIEKPLQNTDRYNEHAWKKRELENYFCRRDLFVEYARRVISPTLVQDDVDLFAAERQASMEKVLDQFQQSMEIVGKPSPWGDDIKPSDEVFPQILKNYHLERKEKVPFTKRDYCQFVRLMKPDQVDAEIVLVLDLIYETASRAREMCHE